MNLYGMAAVQCVYAGFGGRKIGFECFFLFYFHSFFFFFFGSLTHKNEFILKKFMSSKFIDGTVELWHARTHIHHHHHSIFTLIYFQHILISNYKQQMVIVKCFRLDTDFLYLFFFVLVFAFPCRMKYRMRVFFDK